MIDKLQKIPPTVVEQFLADRNPAKYGIPKAVADYIIELNDATNIHKKYGAITEASRRLHELHPALSLSLCKQRIYDSINYLHSDMSVTASAWNMYFADEMFKLRDLNILKRDFKEARLNLERAREYRIAASKNIVDPNRVKFKPQIVSPDVELDRMGIKSGGLLKAWTRLNKIINDRDISEPEKERLRKEMGTELNIHTVDYESVES